ncbi:MAG: hypothetical protein J6K14_04000 [Clostridia bacterium]|nr:hypothetical protein [Clostridia bacterium]
MDTNNVYETLYNNMKQRFTVVSGENEYTLGGYMVMKAKEKQAKAALPATITTHRPMALQSVFSYINRKLTVKEAPAPEKTIKAFPLRTALSAACSALLVCTLMFSFGALNGLMPSLGNESGYIALAQEESPEETEEQVAMNEKI